MFSMDLNFNRQKDVAAGEVPVAFVVKSNSSEVSEEAVKEFIAKQVSTYIHSKLKSNYII